jgi:hypothetical protein
MTDSLWSRAWNKALYKLCRPVPPYSETVSNHIGAETIGLTSDREVLVIPECTVWHRYSVAYRAKYIARETVKCPDRTAYLYESLRRFPRIRIDGTVTTIGDLWPLNYYHKFVDMVPKLYGLHQEALGDRKMTLVLDGRFDKGDLPVIRALLPEKVSIRRLPSMRRVECDEYVHLPRLSVPPHKPCKNLSQLGGLPQDYIRFYRKQLLNAFGIRFGNADSTRRIFISRAGASKRRMLNEESVAKFLEPFGFEHVALEEMALLDQIELFAEASIVVGQHGAGLTNLLYVPSGTMIVEIFSSPDATPPHYSSAIDLLDLDYRSLHMDPVNEGKGKDADGRVPIEDLKQALTDLSES